jgi:hypothetical protein
MKQALACLMAENGHAFAPGAALDVEHHFLLKLHQARMALRLSSGTREHQISGCVWAKSVHPRKSGHCSTRVRCSPNAHKQRAALVRFTLQERTFGTRSVTSVQCQQATSTLRRFGVSGD